MWPVDGCGRRSFQTLMSRISTLIRAKLTWLEDACRLTDRLERLEVELEAAGTYMTIGVAKQPVAHPLLAEIRQTRALRAQMLARIVVSAPEEKLTQAGFPR